MSTAMMVTRVSLLLLVTGLFAGMWSADSPDERTAAEKQLARRASSPCSVANHAVSRPANSVVKKVSLGRRGDAQAIPLPRGIVPGMYLVVDQTGTTKYLSVTTAARNTVSSNFSTVDQYTMRQGDSRWHFIRLEQPLAPQMSQKILEVRAAALH